MIDLSTGKPFSRRDACKGLAAIIAAGCAPSIVLAAGRSAGSIGGLLGSANATVGRGMMRGVGGRLAAMSGGLPYDEELEYIETNGNQYINTNVIASSSDVITFMMIPCVGYIWGRYISYSTTHRCVRDNSIEKLSFEGFGVLFESISTDYVNQIIVGNSYVSVNGYVKNTSQMTYDYPIILATQIKDGSPTESASERIYSLKIGGKLSSIPVLKDGVPCMYDRVSGRFFCNQVSGHQFGYKKKDGTIVQPT